MKTKIPPRIISLAKARELLGNNVVICLEPPETMEQKIEDGKGDQLWTLDPETGVSGRGDKKFFQVRLIDRGGFNQPVIYEEPSVEKSGDKRVVGQIIIETWDDQIVVRKAKGVSGDILELKPSSISKGELVKNGIKPIGFIEANPQRIVGTIEVYKIKLDEEPTLKPGEELMYPSDFTEKSSDARSLAALAVAGIIS